MKYKLLSWFCSCLQYESFVVRSGNQIIHVNCRFNFFLLFLLFWLEAQTAVMPHNWNLSNIAGLFDYWAAWFQSVLFKLIMPSPFFLSHDASFFYKYINLLFSIYHKNFLFGCPDAAIDISTCHKLTHLSDNNHVNEHGFKNCNATENE